LHDFQLVVMARGGMGYSVRVAAWTLVLLGGGSGCATCPAQLEAALNRPVPGRLAEVGAAYTLACPDRMAVTVAGRPELSGEVLIEPDGCAELRGLGRVRVDGATAADVAGLVAQAFQIPATQVSVSVVTYASRHVVLFGPGEGVQRVVPYVGPETVTDLLRRTGGLVPGTSFQAVHVVRPHVAAGRRPEIYPVDLKAIVMDGDPQTDVRLEAYDQVYLGETRGSSVARCLPPWLRAMLPGMKGIDTQVEVSKE
jgi:polysaccharide biosynthesis/export protein